MDKAAYIIEKLFGLITTFFLAFANCACALRQIQQFESCNIALLSLNIIVCLMEAINFVHKIYVDKN